MYKYYGGKNIKVCNDWIDDFVAFSNWALKNGYRDDLTIDRINVDGDYEPSNCRWVDMKTQCINKRMIQSNNKSGYRGVAYRGDEDRYRVRINVDGKTINIGGYKTKKEAVEARNKYIIDNGLDKMGHKIQEYKGE